MCWSSYHESEKPFDCEFCKSRFYNNNEAKRHRSSQHERPFVWSCSSLMSLDRVFFQSTSSLEGASTCGFCGEEFPPAEHAADESLAARTTHLQAKHNYVYTCPAKFFRADHFQQHACHSHRGGTWTRLKQLSKNACAVQGASPPR